MLFRLAVYLCALCALCGESVFAASPSLANVEPHGGQRGTEVVLTFSGSRLKDAQEVLVYYPGIAVKGLQVVDDRKVKVTVAVAPDCRLGEHLFRLRTATGVSDARTFWVGALPTADDKEPNSEFDTPQPIPLNSTVNGTIGGEDVDYFVVECKKGQRLSVEVEGMRLGVSYFDPFVAILNEKRFEIASSDDAPTVGRDCGCSVKIPADGKYTVQIRESAYTGSGAYRLHVGTFPRPTAVIPAGGRPNEEVELRFICDPMGELRQKVKLPPAADPLYRAHCETPDGVHPAGFKLRVVDVPGVVESGSNAAPDKATAGPCPGAFHGVASKNGETDYFKFTAKKGEAYDVRCYARQLGSPLDSVVAVTNDKGGQLAANDDSGGPDSGFRLSIPADGTYLLTVRDHLNKGGPDYFYRLEVTQAESDIAAALQRQDGNNPTVQRLQSVVVPKGNRYAALVNVTRTDARGEIKGPLAIAFDALPPGVAVTAEPVEPGMTAVPVVFEATEAAAVGGLLAPMRAKPTDPAVKVPARTLQPVFYCLGPNNTGYHRHDTDRIAVAVADAVPFEIEVVEPKVPLVQNGSYSLKVVAKRKPGFTKPITVTPVWTPPGIGIATSATIPEGGTETTLAMNATGNAPVRAWRTAVLGQSDAGEGPVYASSRLFKIEVAPPFVQFALERAMVEQGGKTTLYGKVTVAAPFDGKAKVKLLGLPNKVTANDLELTKDATDLTFEVAADKTSPAGKHQNIFCQVVIEKNGEPIVASAGKTEVRVDVPLPPKPNATAQTTPAKPNTPAPPQPAGQPAKRLTRLEQLRLEQEEREKAGKK